MNQSTSTVRPEIPAGQLVFQVASGYMASAALQLAMRLDIAARLSNGPRPVADLAREAGVQTDGLLDLEMMLFPGGRERTSEEFRALFNRAGFTLTKVVPTAMLSVVEARAR